MIFKKTVSLLGNNYVTHLKSLAFQLFLLAFIIALFGLFFYDFGTNVVNAVREERLLEQTQTILSMVRLKVCLMQMVFFKAYNLYSLALVDKFISLQSILFQKYHRLN